MPGIELSAASALLKADVVSNCHGERVKEEEDVWGGEEDRWVGDEDGRGG